MNNYHQFLLPELQEAQYVLTKAQENLKYALEKVECEHPIILCAEYKRLEYFESLKAVRMCVYCRLEEHAHSIWNNGSSTWGIGELEPTTTRLFVATDRETIYKLRLRDKPIDLSSS